MSEITVPADINELNNVQDIIEVEVEHLNPSIKSMTQLQLVVEEVFVNVSKYAYKDCEGTVTIRCETDSEKGVVRITFIDSGIRFNPLAREDPDITAPSEKRPIGGLGIFLVKKNTDSQKYEYIDGKNVFTLEKKLV